MGLRWLVAQRYEVKGWPSMVMSTRWAASLTMTATPLAGDAPAAAFRVMIEPAISPIAKSLDVVIRLASNHHHLRLLVEGHLLAGLDGRHIHAQCDGVAVARADAGIRRLARAHALHPVAHVGVGLRVAAARAPGVRVG